MWRLVAKVSLIAVLQCAAGGVMSAPVAYSFSTSESPFGTLAVASLFGSDALVSGKFNYDGTSPNVDNIATGRVYGGHTPGPGKDPSFSELFGTVSGRTFSDERGVAIVGNDRPPGFVDSLALSADPSLSSTSPRNLNGFTIGNYTLVNVRLFWLEGQMAPDLISDFLQNEDLPAALPTFNGRLALDFIQTGSPTSPTSFVFFDGLTVTAGTPISEPETLALLLVGLGSLAYYSPRRRVR